jgi:hypothetical protein
MGNVHDVLFTVVLTADGCRLLLDSKQERTEDQLRFRFSHGRPYIIFEVDQCCVIGVLYLLTSFAHVLNFKSQQFSVDHQKSHRLTVTTFL